MRIFETRMLSLALLYALLPFGTLRAQPPTSGIYRIRSAYLNDNRCADLRTQDNVTLQLMPCNNAATSERFQVTLTGDGTYTIKALNNPSSNGIDYVMDGSGNFIASACNNCDKIRWKIQPAAGSSNPSVMNIIWVIGATGQPLARNQLWNRMDSDDAGRIQLINAGPPDPHNNWVFLPTK